jgi:uncharacterized RDD family membrane protein YckC
MTDPTLSPVSAPSRIPEQATGWEHPLRPEAATFPAPEAGPFIAAPADESYAHWWRRVVATLIDTLLVIPFWVAGVIGSTIGLGGTTFLTDGTGGFQSITHVVTTTETWVGASIAVVAYLSLLVFSVWNQWVRQGRRGASIGKACLHLMVVSERDGRPIGVFATIIRAIAHLLDTIPFYLGYLWPLVDRRGQTFADKVMGSVVLYLPPLPPRTPQIPYQATSSHGS